MGRHKEKYRRSKKDKKEKKKLTRKHSSSSSSEEEWVEKKVNRSSSDSSSSEEKKIQRKRVERKRRYSSNSTSEDEKYGKPAKTQVLEDSRNSVKSNDKGESSEQKTSKEELNSKRDDWMSLPTAFLTTSNSDRKKRRDEEKKLERERQQYNPGKCARELNPYWKNGGDGLPTFKKPEDSDDECDRRQKSYGREHKYGNRTSNWKKRDTETHLKSKKEETLDKNPSKTECSDKKKRDEDSSAVTEENTESVLSEKELNLLAAKLVKAEIMGSTKLVNELKEKLETARNSRKNLPASHTSNEEVLLMHTDSQGRTQPVKLQSEYGESGQHRRKKTVETHKDGQRVKYFADDDKYTLKQMFENEKYNSVEDQNSEFVKMASNIRKNDDLDDVFTDNIRKKESDSKIDSRNRDRAINEHQKVSKSLDNCNKCIQSESMSKHLMISMGETAYLALPPYEPLTDGHCLIIPIRHVPCTTQLDENEWSDIVDMRKSLVKLFCSRGEDVIFFESAMSLHRFPHMYIECIPLPKEEGDMAPIYFKKAIDESETEWAQNKKLVSLKGRDVRKAVPKGLPYFSVSFGMEEGYAHVIEDEQLFPANFAQEIIGGMLDLHHSKWRKPKRQSFDEQSKRVLQFSKEWKDFDCTV